MSINDIDLLGAGLGTMPHELESELNYYLPYWYEIHKLYGCLS